MRQQVSGMADSVYANYRREAACPPRFHSGQGILEDGRLRRMQAERVGSGQVHVRGRFAGQMLLGGDEAVDSAVEEVADMGGIKDLRRVGAGGHNGAEKPTGSDGANILDRVVENVQRLREISSF